MSLAHFWTFRLQLILAHLCSRKLILMICCLDLIALPLINHVANLNLTLRESNLSSIPVAKDERLAAEGDQRWAAFIAWCFIAFIFRETHLKLMQQHACCWPNSYENRGADLSFLYIYIYISISSFGPLIIMKTCLSVFESDVFFSFIIYLKESFLDSLPLKKCLLSRGEKPSDLLDVFIERLLKGTEIIWHLKIDFVTSSFHAEQTVMVWSNERSSKTWVGSPPQRREKLVFISYTATFAYTHTETALCTYIHNTGVCS